MFELNYNELCSGLFSDVMDKLGYRNQIITGFKRNLKFVSTMGRARTILLETKETDDENIRTGLSFLSECGGGEILVVSGSDQFAYFGELMTKLSTRQNISGVIIDGLTRDTNYTSQSNVTLPIIARGYSPVDIKGRGRVQYTDVSITIDNITVEPGTLIYADNEAVCIVPKEIEEEVIVHVKEKLIEEKRISRLIESGMSIVELLESVTEF